MRVLLITNIIAPYRVPLFNYIHTHADFDFRVWFMAETQSNRTWAVAGKELHFNYEILPNWSLFFPKKEFGLQINRGVLRRLCREDPDVIIIGGYTGPTAWLGLFFAKMKRRPIIFWSGSILKSRSRRSFLVGRIRRFIISRCDAYVAYGNKAKEYQVFYGADPQRITISTNTVDVKRFRETSQSSPTTKELRGRYSSSLFLYCGRLTALKGIAELFRAVEALHKTYEFNLLIVGDGPMRAELEAIARSQKLTNVHFMGFIQRNNLPAYYGASDVFVFPSFYDCWGLVINEALACGTFTLASQYAGATADLIRPEFNGLLFDPKDTRSFRRAFVWALEHLDTIRERREAITADASRRFSIAKSAQAFINCVQQTITTKR